MKKKITLVATSVLLVAAMVIGGTLAYFTDTDYDKNVMTTGNISIEQIEQERGDSGMQEFTPNKTLFPATGDANGDGKIDSYGDDNMMQLENNAVDKIVSVKNTGNTEAYIRTLIAFEVPEAAEGQNGNLSGVNGSYIDVVNVDPYLYTVMSEGATVGKGYTLPMEGDKYVVIEVDGVSYLVTEYYYKNDSKLAGGATSHTSLQQVYLSANATNEDVNLVVGADNNYNILVLSQAVQTEGFTSAKTALDTAFGVVNTANAQEWFTTAAS